MEAPTYSIDIAATGTSLLIPGPLATVAPAAPTADLWKAAHAKLTEWESVDGVTLAFGKVEAQMRREQDLFGAFGRNLASFEKTALITRNNALMESRNVVSNVQWTSNRHIEGVPTSKNLREAIISLRRECLDLNTLGEPIAINNVALYDHTGRECDEGFALYWRDPILYGSYFKRSAKRPREEDTTAGAEEPTAKKARIEIQ